MSQWLEVTLPVTPESVDDVCARLVAEGFESFQIEDISVILYLPTGDTENLGRLRRLCPPLTVRERREEEWSDAWKQYYKPTPIGERLLIQPVWQPLESPGNRMVYLNDPGMAFGTGLHASTRLCLELLETLDLAVKRVLDVGCGSGILGLCALLLGAGGAVGVDIDPHAARIAEKNARLNGVEARFTTFAGDFISDDSLRESAGGFDIVFSNIIADIIIMLAPVIAPSMTDGALWVASGIIEGRLDDVLSAANAAGLTTQCVRVEDGWAAVQFACKEP
ncbi:MAG: 50S ribosomal protein L11 methyltransferase [Oscillospiraceae bacterium]|jgi:ribosomal protein L11 methyltransferase|nr:50S ribosomal protein L11 methyltransferase [Oscillospiraceae bacterium]